MLVNRKPNAAATSTDNESARRFARVREVYELLQEADAASRVAVLERECAGDESLKTTVQKLMESSGPLHESFDPDRGDIARALLRRAPSQAPLGRVGPYRVLRELGRGGMGTVYLAEQDFPRREIALKVLEGRHETDAMALRFAREVRAQARLDHPGIARIYDAGSAETTHGTVCYFAMQHIEGTRLTQHADDHALDTPARLALLAAVADAVQHAHSNGVIHRDLKPSNVLVRHEGASTPRSDPNTAGRACPVILDFGVARVLDAEQPESALTDAGLLVGTIAYMSPEQLSGEPNTVDARTDVFALGVLLFELLTGRLPFDVRTKPVAEAARIIRDDPPAPLNAPGSASSRRFDRDITLIVAKALEKDREQRYRTAAALADDLRRYLAHEPIVARPSTLTYQLARFSRRHRGLVGGVAIAAMTLFVGLCVSVSLYFRAEQQRADAEQQRAFAQEQQAHAEAHRARADAESAAGAALQGYLLDDVLKAAAPDRLGQNATIVDVLLDTRVGLSERFVGQPEEEARVRAALADVFSALGRLPEASAEREDVVRVLEARYGPDDERVIEAMLQHSRALAALRRTMVAERIAEDAVQRIRRAHPANEELLMHALLCAARCCQDRSHYARAISLRREASEIAARLPGDHRGLVLSTLGSMLYCERRRREPNAEAAAELARQIRDQVHAISPDDPALPHILQSLMKDDLARGSTDDALVSANLLAPLLDREASPQHIAPMAAALARTFFACAELERAEAFALKGFEAYGKAFPNGVWNQEELSRVLVDIYASWSGHDEALHAWCVRWIACRFMFAGVDIRGGCMTRIREAESLLRTTSRSAVASQLLDDVWEMRDQFVPIGHGRRVVFLTNFEAVAESLGHSFHAAEAHELAKASAASTMMPDASGKSDARERLNRK